MRTLDPIAARMGVALPAVVLGARVLESTFGRPTCFGRACVGPGSAGFLEITLVVMGLGFVSALRTGLRGPRRWMGAVGVALVASLFFAPSFALEVPALRALWP